MSAHAQTLSLTPEHYTPAEWVERARRVMGGIDLDPCSCADAQRTVRALAWYDADQDGLTLPWNGRVFINSPGDRRGQLPKLFWEKLADEVEAGHVEQFVWLAFNAAQLRTLQRTSGAFLLQQCEVFIPASRIRFTGDSPTKDNAFLYWGPRRIRFRRVFGPHGLLLEPSMGEVL